MSDAALNKHLDEISRADAEASAVDMLKDQWLSHPGRVETAWIRILKNQELMVQLLLERSLRSGQFSGMPEEISDSMFLGKLDTMLSQELEEMASEHLESEADQNAIDAALDAAEDKEYWRSHE